MTTPAPGHRPGHTVNLLISLAVRALPAAERPRYDTEWRAELFYTARPRRLPATLSLLRGCIPLAHELEHRPTRGSAMPRRKDWRCRLGFHKYVRKEPPHMTRRLDYWFECQRCGKFHDSVDGSKMFEGAGGGGGNPGM